ncbi:MAG TPA: metal-dependent transcriptional regulator [Chloroflexota bacterium]|nr:metal-dependent transcriptional regulator [Chloroflexota bacterium]
MKRPTAFRESTAEQDYLKQIYLLQENVGRATTQMLADRLGVKPPSVTAMIKRLAEDENGPLVEHTPYRGVELTDRGMAVALEMLRHHRLIELFLSELLGVPWDRVHEEAERLEHVLSEDLEDRIAAKLGNPTIDPHGDPIPSREGVMPPQELARLTALPFGSGGTIGRIEQQEQAVLQYLESLGLVLNASVTLEEIAPFGGVVSVRVDGPEGKRRQAIGLELANRIMVHTSPADLDVENA